MKKLSDIGEDHLISDLIANFPTDGLHTGPGDDCAVIEQEDGRLRLLKTDAIVEGVHYEPDAAAEEVGWKAVARVLSDFAAMGGKPEYLMVTVALPADMEVSWARSLYDGIHKCLDRHGGILAGGETSRVPEGSSAVISVAGEGSVECDHLMLRSGGRRGDLLAVTGHLGGSIKGKHLNFTPRLAEGQWLAANGATSMMDLSDGLAKDLQRLTRACGCGALLDRDAIPTTNGCTIEQAMNDGEDYELLVTLDPESDIMDRWPDNFAPLSIIGKLSENGEQFDGGWDHFTK